MGPAAPGSLRAGVLRRGCAFACAPTRASSSQGASSSSTSSSSPSSTSSPGPRGAIHLIVGPMFAGKTSKLLEEAQHVSSHQGDDVLYLKSSKDNRYSESHIATHTGIQVPCFAVSHLIRDVLPGMDGGSGKREGDRATPSAISQRYASSRVVAIDEAQFFGEDLVEFCTRAADDDAKTVVVAGLDGDFLRGRFGHVLDLVPLSDSVVKLRARCAVCGERAVFSRKIDGDLGRQEEIGSSETYVAVCRRCYTHSNLQDER